MRAEESSRSPKGTDQRRRAIALLKSKGMLRLKDFALSGIGGETLARLVRENTVVRRARGLYQLADAEIATAHILAEAAILVPRGVICLISALQFHELTVQVPVALWMAIERTAWRPRIQRPPMKFVRWTKRFLEGGIVRHRIEGISVPITDPTRTVVDCFRYRNKVGMDVALEGLREALRQRRCTPDDLWRHAKPARVWSVMRPYVEAAVSQGD